MGVRANEEIIAHWLSEPAPLLPILHAFHDRDGYLSEGVLREVSRSLGIDYLLSEETLEVHPEDVAAFGLTGGGYDPVTHTAELKVCPVRVEPE